MSRASFLRGRIGRQLSDTYTRDAMTIVPDDVTTVGVDESTGPWGEAITQEGGTETIDGLPVSESTSGVACMWIDAGSILRDQDGVLTLATPSIVVAYDDPLREGDQIRNVIDKDGTLRMTGPAVVESSTDYGPPGYTALRQVWVRFVEAT